ncbi:acyl-CoA dehydrogenase family protein [Actinokineospora bangkokensis]|uniref:Acyl-CoA dehydrogenase n=1 Tax=Actinokineospora bangkokensis TaxID=1193682 RepID=A0A1Q9LIU0_9PSEU|nr:acyl-CoA dehydrogenase family protein [Actinokineospora bangkokensis]OLR91933.1 hypothetical protein BJP25_24200 [Actinokineospora bangkokensis]
MSAGEQEDPVNGWRTAVREFCERELRPHAVEWAEAGRVDRGLWRRAGADGLLCADVPTAYGGGGRGFAAEVAVVEEQARVGDTAWGFTAHEVVAQYVLAGGTEAQRRRWLPGLASGELVGAIAMSEPGAGSDLGALTTRAEPDGDEFVLWGTKAFVTNGGLADLVVAPVMVAGALSLLVVDTRAAEPGRSPVVKIGRRGQDTVDLCLDGLRVPAADLLGGEVGGAAALSMPLMSRERLLIAVAAVAAAEAVLAEAVAWSRRHEVFGRRLIRHQGTRFALAECAASTAAGRALVDDVVRRHVAGGVSPGDAAMVKFWTTERLFDVADRCLQLYGGLGYTAGHPVARAWADARVTRVYGGANEVMREIVAASLAGGAHR